jgi:glycosyltransferase involved in cell wall biosynthesis
MSPDHNLLMLSGDSSIARGEAGAFSAMLSRFSRYWARIDILVPQISGGTERRLFENVYVYPSRLPRPLQPLFIVQKVRQLLAERPYSLITSHDFGIFYNGIGALLLRQPYVSEIHHIEGYPQAVTAREHLYRLLARLYVGAAARRALAFRAVNRTEIPDLLRRWGVPTDKILYLPSTYIDFDLFQPNPDEPRQYDLLFVGRLESNKGIFTLLDAVEQVQTTHPHLRVALLGRGRLEGAIRQRLVTLPSVTLITERLLSAQVARLYQQSALLVCASTSEGGPRVTLEAMACGIAVISTRVGIMPDVIEDGVNGLLFDGSAAMLAASIRRLLDDDEERQRLAANGRASVAAFDAESVIRHYAEGYHDLIARQEANRHGQPAAV